MTKEQFSTYIKFPRISHFPWSPGVTSDDKRFNTNEIEKYFKGKEIIVTEKLDGENTSMYNNHIHARSIDSRNHCSRSWVKNLYSTLGFKLPDKWRICGENVYAKHSILYKHLTTYFYVFSIYNENNICLSWDDTKEYCELLDLEIVPEIYRGIFNVDKIKECYSGKSLFGSDQEGYVMRITDSFNFNIHDKCFAKFVRKNHVTSSNNWMNEMIVKNKRRL